VCPGRRLVPRTSNRQAALISNGSFAARRLGLSVLAVAALSTPAILFLVLQAVPRIDVIFQSLEFHLVVVSLIAALAAAVAGLAAVPAGRSNDAALVFLALGCLAVGLTMFGHGLATPGIGAMPHNLWVARLPSIGIWSFALAQAAALLPRHNPLARFASRRPYVALAVPATMMMAGLALVVRHPEAWIGATPLPYEDAVLSVVGMLSAASLAAIAFVHWRRWRLSGDGVQLALVVASMLAAEAQLSMRLGRMWHLSWWDYHVLLMLGFGSTVYALTKSYMRGRDHRLDLGFIFQRGALAHIARGYPEALRALVAAVEARDAYTRGHSKRVTELSVDIGQRLGLRGDKLRKLVWGAELHDIGKIGIPDYIMQKPGALTPDERGLIEQHPAIGWEIVRKLNSLQEVLEIVRHHHERIDGNGYPDGLGGENIPLSARIVAVADVWDALTSDRAYRPAWSREEAIKVMREGRGTQFDERCLDALLSLLNELDQVKRFPEAQHSPAARRGAFPAA
jgi:putative nucleotidyltransferase with HDIG domain